MRFLIVEDFQHKRERLERVLEGRYKSPFVRCTASVQTAIQALEEESFDVVVLDMSLPVFEYSPSEDGLTHLSFGGRDVLNHLSRVAPATAVVVVTAFPRFGESDDALTLQELDEELRAEFPTQYLGSVWYSDAQQAWEGELLGLIDAFDAGRNTKDA